MTADEPAVAAGGWCAPSETLYDLGPAYGELFTQPDITIRDRVTLPEFSAPRGGITFDLTTSPVTDAIRTYLRRVRALQHATIEAACHTALTDGYDLHVQHHHRSPFLGIEFSRPMRWTIPTVTEHHNDDHWYDLDDPGEDPTP